MKYLKYMALLLAMALLSPFCALARDKNQHPVDIPDAVQVGSTRLNPAATRWSGKELARWYR